MIRGPGFTSGTSGLGRSALMLEISVETTRAVLSYTPDTPRHQQVTTGCAEMRLTTVTVSGKETVPLVRRNTDRKTF